MVCWTIVSVSGDYYRAASAHNLTSRDQFVFMKRTVAGFESPVRFVYDGRVLLPCNAPAHDCSVYLLRLPLTPLTLTRMRVQSLLSSIGEDLQERSEVARLAHDELERDHEVTSAWHAVKLFHIGLTWEA